MSTIAPSRRTSGIGAKRQQAGATGLLSSSTTITRKQWETTLAPAPLAPATRPPAPKVKRSASVTVEQLLERFGHITEYAQAIKDLRAARMSDAMIVRTVGVPAGVDDEANVADLIVEQLKATGTITDETGGIVRQLAEQFGVTRQTVTYALAGLEVDDVITRDMRMGLGTFSVALVPDGVEA